MPSLNTFRNNHHYPLYSINHKQSMWHHCDATLLTNSRCRNAGENLNPVFVTLCLSGEQYFLTTLWCHCRRFFSHLQLGDIDLTVILNTTHFSRYVTSMPIIGCQFGQRTFGHIFRSVLIMKTVENWLYPMYLSVDVSYFVTSSKGLKYRPHSLDRIVERSFS